MGVREGTSRQLVSLIVGGGNSSAGLQHYSFEIENEEVFQDFSDFVSNYLEKKFGLGHMIKKVGAL